MHELGQPWMHTRELEVCTAGVPQTLGFASQAAEQVVLCPWESALRRPCEAVHCALIFLRAVDDYVDYLSNKLRSLPPRQCYIAYNCRIVLTGASVMSMVPGTAAVTSSRPRF